MSGPARNLLIVEDDRLFVRLVGAMLMPQGWTVHGVASGEDAIAALKAQPFDVVITDLNMEGLGGVGLIREIMDTAIFPINRMLVITGEHETGKESAWVIDHKIPILRKPFTSKSLLDALDSVLLSE